MISIVETITLSFISSNWLCDKTKIIPVNIHWQDKQKLHKQIRKLLILIETVASRKLKFRRKIETNKICFKCYLVRQFDIPNNDSSIGQEKSKATETNNKLLILTETTAWQTF